MLGYWISMQERPPGGPSCTFQEGKTAEVMMNGKFRNAAAAVAPSWPLILIVSLGKVIISNRLWDEFLILDLVAVLLLTILIFGRIVSRLVPGVSSGSWTILKENWINYVLAIAIIGAPQAVLRIWVAGQLSTPYMHVVLAIVFSALFGVLTIYALPIVFLRKSSLAAILAGVAYLFKNLAASCGLAAIVVFTHVLAAAGAVIFRMETAPWSFVLVMVLAVVTTFLTFVVFAAALGILLGNAEQ